MEKVIGIDPTKVDPSAGGAAFKLGTLGGYDHPTLGTQVFAYMRATGAVTGLGYLCVESTGYRAQMATTANTAAGTFGFGSRLMAAQAAMADGDYGWFQIYGKGSLRTLASAAVGTRLNTTATAGVPDDDGTAGARTINGLTLGTATGGAQATNADATFTFPVVGLTI